ncbi:MAG: FkbM family methyltransferase [Bacteroidia bacterium]|nr:FkbM family methyltransferase [Bacteroidia bacterium]HRO07526.1 FkbM family methyltransferase [Saprospiraceae bacterium]HRP40809.1 FkbM family methyltransferase [Saprospiraceae bacterium]
MDINKEKLFATIDFYNSKNLLTRIFKKFSYFHKQLYICYLIKTNNIRKFKTQILTGDKMEIVLPDNISLSLYLIGFFEGEETKAFLTLMKPGETFIDIGAHIGYYSVLAKAIGGIESKVISIEPTPSTFNILKENMQNRHNTTLMNIGLYATEGKMEFNDFGIQQMCLNSFKEARLDHKISGEKINIKVETLDSIVHELKIEPSIIKIDAESAELDIIKGGLKTLSSYNVRIFIEVGDFEHTGSNNSIKIIEALEALQYRVYELMDNKFIPHQKSKDKYPSMSLYFSKEPI